MSVKYYLENIPYEFWHDVCFFTNRLLKRRPSSAPFLSGDSYRKTADFLYDNTTLCSAEEINTFQSNLQKKRPVVFVTSRLLKDFSSQILPHIHKSFILVTHQSDENITDDALYTSIANDEHVYRWFAQNCMLRHEKLIPLPIGLEDLWRHNAGDICDFKKKSFIKKNKKPRILYGFNIATNAKDRVPCYLAMWRKPTTELISRTPNMHLYRKLLSSFMFVASPSGNGLDCHRTWEAMYFGVIPIVPNNYMNNYFASLGLPIWCVSSWDEATSLSETELAKKYSEIISASKTDALWLNWWTTRFYGD